MHPQGLHALQPAWSNELAKPGEGIEQANSPATFSAFGIQICTMPEIYNNYAAGRRKEKRALAPLACSCGLMRWLPWLPLAGTCTRIHDAGCHAAHP